MSCTKHVMGLPWTHHDWQRRVTGFEIREGEESTIWGRSVTRNYVRCDTEEACTACGDVRRQGSCTCDIDRGERCPLLVEWREAQGQTGNLLS